MLCSNMWWGNYATPGTFVNSHLHKYPSLGFANIYKHSGNWIP